MDKRRQIVDSALVKCELPAATNIKTSDWINDSFEAVRGRVPTELFLEKAHAPHHHYASQSTMLRISASSNQLIRGDRKYINRVDGVRCGRLPSSVQQMFMGSAGQKTTGVKRSLPEHGSATVGSSDDGATSSPAPSDPPRVPLKYVVREAVQRWFEEARSEAERGDIKICAMVGNMYNEGYGCPHDPKAAKVWRERGARYKQEGVYCEL
eukprot:gene25484-11142_t